MDMRSFGCMSWNAGSTRHDGQFNAPLRRWVVLAFGTRFGASSGSCPPADPAFAPQSLGWTRSAVSTLLEQLGYRRQRLVVALLLRGRLCSAVPLSLFALLALLGGTAWFRPRPSALVTVLLVSTY